MLTSGKVRFMKPKRPSFSPEFGELVRYYRVLQGLTLDEIGKEIKMHKMVLSQMERGLSSPPSLPVLEKLAGILKIPKPDLQKFVDAGIKSRMSGPRGLGRRAGRKTLRIVGGPAPESRQKDAPITVRRNPQQVWDDPVAALSQAIQDIHESHG